jgi:hypothetical protein
MLVHWTNSILLKMIKNRNLQKILSVNKKNLSIKFLIKINLLFLVYKSLFHSSYDAGQELFMRNVRHGIR